MGNATLAARFWAKVDVRGSDECWPWTGCRARSGYGRIGSGGHRGPIINASRASWEVTHGPIPEGLHVCHRCDNPPCVNPAHLFLGTHSENMRDMWTKGRANKPKGEAHPCARFTAEQVREIREIVARGEASHRELGRQYGVSHKAIGRIAARITWGHV